MIIAFQTLIYFRESLLTALDWLIPIWPYYKKWTLSKNGEVSEESDEDQVFADYDEEKGVVFFPPVYAQRYAAVADCLMDERWAGKIEKVVDFGYNDMSFIKYLKDVPGIKCILGVDIESLPLRCSSGLLGGNDYAPRNESPLQITLYQGNAADPDYRLIGCDAVVAIEMIEHMLPHDLERLVHTVFGFIKPQIAVFTTPNGDFNVLFKALEKNGLRRLDHFFEWSREQFHDWCSNIVSRYPEYTVTCKGIGPGPAGTQRLGCCSQLALFVCKDYHKQQDLDLNCLALVAKAPKQLDLDEMTDSWDSPDPITETNMICGPDDSEIYPEIMFSEKQSYMTIVFESPGQSLEHLEYKDKYSQCNIEAERGRNFLMFDEEILCYNVLIPQRKITTNVYEFEDVTNRLNCTTLQVKKFSKTTQNLMARNKQDSLVHTREIVDEIRHMTKMLNFDKNTLKRCSTQELTTWNNINWGDDAPYWNQYYKIIKEFNFPFETKSDECRILDLISEEINRLIDMQDSQFCFDSNKLEIPLDHLMQVVQHITDDLEKVKELLEWNGYEIADNVVIYSRLVVDNTSVGSLDDEWQDNDAISDWDTTDVQSMSDASTMMPNLYGRGLQRALDLKLKKLRSLLTADEDITTELDRIVCRLMKLALRTSKDHQTPPPTTWMQRKLLDLLSLTEKAIERRRKHLIENYSTKAIGYDTLDNKHYKIKSNEAADKILNKYLMLTSDLGNESCVRKSEVHATEDLSVTSNEMEPYTLEPMYGELRVESVKSESKEELRLQITQAWVDDYEVDSPVDYNIRKSDIKCSDSTTSNDSQNDNVKSQRLCTLLRKQDRQVILGKSSNHIGKSKIKERKSINKLIKKVSKKHSNSGQLARKLSKKFEIFEYQSYTVDQSKKKFKEHHNFQPTSSKPIPRSLIELCYQDVTSEKNDRLMDYSLGNINNDVAATKGSLFIDIISEDNEETIALRRTIATEIDWNSDGVEADPLFETVINVTKDDSFDGDYVVPTKTVDSETIFLYDLNEPSTSKGIRHVNADVQCGTDILGVCPTPSVVSSRINGSNIRELGIKIGDSFTKLEAYTNSIDFGTVTDEKNIQKDILSIFNKRPIRIKDSYTDIPKYVECATMTGESDLMLDPDQVVLKVQNFEGSISDLSKRALHCFINQNNIITSRKNSLTKYIRPKLSWCGIHVHSYRDRQVSEDVVFQGEWQRNGPKIVAKKSPYAQITAARKYESSVKKKKIDSKVNISSKLQDNKVIKMIEKKSFHKRNMRLNNTKQVLPIPKVNKEPSIVNSTGKNIRQGKNVTKVSSKIITSITSKNVNNTGAVAAINKPATKSNNMKGHNKRFNDSREKLCSDSSKKTPDFNLNKLNRTTDSVIPKVKEKTSPLLKRSKSELKAELLKLKSEKQNNRTYIVFRNEIESSRSTNSSSPNSKPLMKINSSKNNNISPSQNSSPCSSRNSFVTVRALPLRTKPHCNKNNFTSLGNNNSGIITVEDIENSKNERYIKKGKNSKLMNVGSKDKENLPETSTKYFCNKNDTDKSLTHICDKNQKVFMLQVSATADSPPSIVRKKSDSAAITFNNPNTKLLNKNADNRGRKRSPSPTKKSSTNDKCESSFFKEEDKYLIINADAAQYDYVTDHMTHFTGSSTPVSQKESKINEVEAKKSYQKNDTESILKRSKSKINAAMKQLIEERLSFIKKIEDGNVSDSETVILSRDDNEETLNETSSPVSYKTVLTNENTCNITGSDIEYALLNYSIASDVGSPTIATSFSGTQSIDTDQISFKSIETLAKSSPYNSKQYDLDSTLVPNDVQTVRDIFERKEQHITMNTGTHLAVQVFSGFSMDREPVGGDQPEYTSLVNPETGNLSVEVTRQVTSEELFVSGRSSDTYESCYVEDDAYVPNWLFHVISQQQSEEIAEEEQEPEARDGDGLEFDANGNAVEAGFGAGVGAGDGRGMHSDPSQDSSGRGTSISSSDVSSGPQSEAILIDPSAFLGSVVNEVPIIIDATSTVPAESSDTSFRTVETMETDNEIQYSRVNVQRRPNRTACASDVDADISSLGTDAADSDN